MYTDTLFGPRLSSQLNTCSQLYATDFEWSQFYPMTTEREAHTNLGLLHHQHGVPTVLMPDNMMALTAGNFKKKARAAGSIIHPIEAHMPNQHKAEATVREIKRMHQHEMHCSSTPLIFWDKCFQLQCLIHSHTALHKPTFKGMTQEERLKGETADIPFLVEFQWYQRVWMPSGSMAGSLQYGRWRYGKLGTHHESNGGGKDFCYSSHTTGPQ